MYVRLQRPGSRLVKDRCTDSISSVRHIREGDQTGEAYSSKGRMNDLIVSYVSINRRYNTLLDQSLSVFKKTLKTFLFQN